MISKEEFLSKARADPVWLYDKLWPKTPLWSQQQDILRAIFRDDYITVRASNGVGKSFVAARAVICLMMAYPGCEIVTTATTWDQIELVLWKEIKIAHASASIPLGGTPLNTKWELAPGWMAYGLSTNTQARFIGHHSLPIFVIEDEASGVPLMIDEATRSLITSEGCKLIKIGNPIDPSGHFYDSFSSQLFTKFSISAFDTPNFTTFGITEQDIMDGTWAEKITGPLPFPQLPSPKWVSDRYIEYDFDNPWVECFIRGNFPTTAIDTLISLADCQKGYLNEPEPDGRKAIGVDVARFGLDETVIVGYDQGRIEILDTVKGQDTMKTAEKAIKYRDQYQSGLSVPVTIGVDDIGVGGGVADRLTQLGAKVVPFRATEKSNKWGKFNSLTASAWWAVRDALRNGKLKIPRDETLTAQLVGRKYKPAVDGQIELERKDEMVKRGLKSPDRADALMIAFTAAQWGKKINDDKKIISKDKELIQKVLSGDFTFDGNNRKRKL